VRAKAKAGFEDVGLYRNDGYSNLFTFRYGDPCPAPQSLALEAKTSDAISATWDAPVGATTGGIRYKIAYRKYSAAGQWSWVETETSDLFRTISDLEPATEYELKVGVPCSQTNEVVYTPSQRITTLAAGQLSGIECGKEPVIDITNQKLIESLKAGDVVMANDFPTTISSVTGTSQGWSGEGWTKVPWLGDTRIHVTYASIKVNSDYKLIDGSFITTYDPTGKNIGDIDKTIDDAVGLYTGGTDVGKVVTGEAATSYTVPYTITPADNVGSTFTANTTGGGTITLGNGQTLTVSNLPTTVQDAAGTIYQADDKGKLTKVGTNSSNAGTMLATANLTVVDASKGTVTFAPTSDMKYAFDAWQKAYDGNSAWSKRYETLPISGQSGKYRVSSKLMVPGEADKVLAMINLNDKSIAAGSVQFVNAKGTLFEKDSITPTSYKINLVSGPAGDAQEVYALYSTGGKTYTLGKLLVATYEPKTISLALVPVNGATLDSKTIAEELKKVYEPLGIDFNLTTKDRFKYKALETASLKVEGSGLLSVYTDQMKALNAAFVASGGYDKNTIYLFAIDQPESQDGKSIEGVMPRGQQFGYMFVKGKNGDAQGLTAAHELGHGVFQLQHTFSYSGIKQKAITPLNLMDYPMGEALSKLQWDLMHDQGLVISVFETDKGVESSTTKINCYCHDDPTEWKIPTWMKDFLPTSSCEEITRVLSTLQGCTDTQTLEISNTDKENKTLTASTLCLQIQNEKITKLRVVWFTEQMRLTENTESIDKYQIDFKKTDLKDYESADNKQRGLAHYNSKGKTDLMLLIDEPDDNTFKIQREALKKYFFGAAIQERKSTAILVDNALKSMTQYIGNPYKQENNNPPDYLRTAETNDGVEKMDCSEFVSRFLKQLGLFSEVPCFTTGLMITDKFKKDYSDKLQYIKGSKTKDFKDIKPGDIFVWNNGSSGHTGIVKSYDSKTDIVEVMEALGSSGSRDNSRNTDSCVGCIRISKYNRVGDALVGHSGWFGYYRPNL